MALVFNCADVSRLYYALKTHLTTGQPLDIGPLIEAWTEETAWESVPLMLMSAMYIQIYPALLCSHNNCAHIGDLRGRYPAGSLPISDNVDPPFLDSYVQEIQSYNNHCSAWPLSREGWFGAPNELVEFLPCHHGTSFLHSSFHAIVSGET